MVNAIELESEARLRKYTDFDRVKCSFCRGILTLQGTVSNNAVRQIAQTVLQSVEGIKVIDNQIEIDPFGSAD